MPNLFLFYRHRSKRDQQTLLDVEDWQKDRKLSRKVKVIKKLAKRGVVGIIIPEDIEL